jgi:hypothetical protein
VDLPARIGSLTSQEGISARVVVVDQDGGQISRWPGLSGGGVVMSVKFWVSNSDICSGPSSLVRAAIAERAGR